jgi:hypothetical protein
MIATTVLLAALALRVGVLGNRDLWYDELLSANFSAHGPWRTLVTVARFDVHPPLYYIQLSLWMTFGASKAWIMANSVAWSFTAVVLALWVGVRRFGVEAGLWAAALLAVCPAALAYADQARMYPMLSALILLVFEAQARWLEKEGPVSTVAMILSQLVLAYSHAIGAFMLLGCLAFTFVQLLLRREPRRLVVWLVVEALIGAASVPALIFGMAHAVTHTAVPNLASFGAAVAFLATGAARSGVLWIAAAGAASALVVWISTRRWETTIMLACLVLTPLVAAAVVSLVARPIWIERIFTPLTPLACLILGRAATLADGRRVRAAVGAIVLFWAAVSILDSGWRPRGDGYGPSARWLRAQALPGDMIVVRDPMTFWALMWSLEGHTWGEPLADQFSNDRWRRLIDKLPGGLRSMLADRRTPHSPIPGVEARLLAPGEAWPEPKGRLFVVRSATFEPPPVGLDAPPGVEKPPLEIRTRDARPGL